MTVSGERRRHASPVSAINLFVEVVAVLFVVGATIRLPWYWHLERVSRPTALSFWSDRHWKRHVRAIMPSVAAGWALVVVFPAAWYSDQSTVAAAILVGGGLLICACAAIAALAALTQRVEMVVPPAWRE
jgi:hypothetical protein